MTDITTTHRPGLILPFLRPLYATLNESAETLLRLVAGGLLVTHGYGKIMNPFGAVGMVEGLGFYPGVFWSPLLAATEFFGGILVAIGLFTRPAALASAIVLAVTVLRETSQMIACFRIDPHMRLMPPRPSVASARRLFGFGFCFLCFCRHLIWIFE